MSNPAVIVLDIVSRWGGRLNRFHIEDNIGESIHIHIDDMRFDFTINEFLQLSELLKTSLDSLDLFDGHSIDSFDEFFLRDIVQMIPYIQNLTIEEIEISKLKCITRVPIIKNIYWLRLQKIKNIPAFQYLAGNKEKFISYHQTNNTKNSNIERINENLFSIQKYGYPFRNQHIILFNKQNIIRDGQHRISALAHLNGLDSKIKIMRINLDNKFRTKILRQNLKNILTKIIYKVGKIFYRVMMFFIKN